MRYYLVLITFALLVVITTKTAQAVPPPDFIFAVGSQIVQIFSILLIAFSVVIGALRRFIQTNSFFVRFGKVAWIILAVVVIVVSLLGAYFFDQYQQNKAYKEWVAESKQQDVTESVEPSGDNLDKLKIGETQGEDLALSGLNNDPGFAFIKSYYHDLGSGNVAQAYAVSSKIVPLETYRSWYKDTTGLTIDSAQKINDLVYSLGLTLREGNSSTRYAVLMTLKPGSPGTYSIAHSEVRVLAGDENSNIEDGSQNSPAFFEKNKQLALAISNQEFSDVIKSSIPYVLDAREDEEYEIGRFPGSNHIRFADLKAGEWIRVPHDQVVYVFCWSGIRGKEVTEFLRSKQIVARYVDTGADGWVDYGGTWNGGIKFLSKYSAERYQIVFSTEQVKQYQQQGVFIVDSRQPAKFQKRHIPGSVSIPIIYTPTSRMEETLNQVPPASTVITVCDDFVSCFDAKVTGVKLEKKGHTFIGRYNKPWEY